MCRSILLFSGGIDSFVGYYYLDKPQPVYFNLKSRYSNAEIHHLKKYFSHTIIDDTLSFLGRNEKNTSHIPYRNLFFMLASAAKYADIIYICGLKDDNVGDKTEEIFNLMSSVMSKAEGKNILIESPFWQMTKLEVCQWFAENHDKMLLLNTYSCYSGNQDECGRCNACFRKRTALYGVGIELPFYDRQIIDYYKKNMSKYDELRQISMKRYIAYLESI